MQVQKIILFYKFTPLADPEAIKLWQRTLCEKLGLKGRSKKDKWVEHAKKIMAEEK